MAEDRNAVLTDGMFQENMETPQISRSGRVLKKSAKVKEMEDFDINELDMQGKSRKKSKGFDDFDEFDDKRVAPIKIPKISLNMQGGSKKTVSSPVPKQIFRTSYQGLVKSKSDGRQSIYHDSSDASKESDSSSMSSESSSSSSSSDASDADDPFPNDSRYEAKKLSSSIQALSVHHDKVIVEPHQYEPPTSFMEQSSGISSDESEDAASDPALVIAEDSDESSYTTKGQRGNARKRGGKNDPNYAPRQGGARSRKKPAAKAVTDGGAAKKKKPAAKGKPLTAYMLWCTENRKKIAATVGNIGYSNVGKKLGEAWQALSEKEKMTWRRKAKQLALKNKGSIINTGQNLSSPTKATNRASTGLNDDLLKSLTESTGTLGNAPIDVAAHLKLLGDSLTVIGQRLIEHEGQLAVSGIYSVLLDTLLCAIGPLLCLTSEIPGLDHVPPETFRKTLDHIAYFMPGL